MNWINRLIGLGLVLALCGAAAAQAPSLETDDLVLQAIPDGPVAIVHNRSVDPIDFRDLYLGELARLRMEAGKDKPITDEMRIGIAMASLRTLVEQQLLQEEAVKRGINVTETEREEAWNTELNRMRHAIAQNRGTPDDLPSEAQVLEMAGATREEALAEIERALVIQKTREAIAKELGFEVTDAEVKEFYEQNVKDDAPLPEKMHLRQMFWGLEKGGGPAERQAAQEKANKAATSVLSGQSFEAVAKKMSEGRYKEQGGDWGTIPVTVLPDFIVEAARKLKPGEMSGIIESEFGFHLIQLVEITPGETITLEKAAPSIKRMLANRKATLALRDWTSEQTNNGEDVNIFLDIERQVMARPELRKRLMDAMPLEEGEDGARDNS